MSNTERKTVTQMGRTHGREQALAQNQLWLSEREACNGGDMRKRNTSLWDGVQCSTKRLHNIALFFFELIITLHT